jgi:hypothetical protein
MKHMENLGEKNKQSIIYLQIINLNIVRNNSRVWSQNDFNCHCGINILRTFIIAQIKGKAKKKRENIITLNQ